MTHPENERAAALTERERFEKWADTRHWRNFSTEGGFYCNAGLQSMWSAWQARAALTPLAPPEPFDDEEGCQPLEDAAEAYWIDNATEIGGTVDCFVEGALFARHWLAAPPEPPIQGFDHAHPDSWKYEAKGDLAGVAPGPSSAELIPCNGLDTPERVRFYEHDFYPLSNFSAFNLRWMGRTFPTSEHAYHWEKFKATSPGAALVIAEAPSAHAAFKLAEARRGERRKDWDSVKLGVMRDILRAKVHQHEYVRRKLLATGNRELVEDSWRDDFWGWGPNRDGQNMLGKLWMEVRAELVAASPAPALLSPSDSPDGSD